MAEIGIPLLLILFLYILYQFIKPQKVNEKKIFINHSEVGSKIPGLKTQKSKKRKNYIR